MKQNSRLRIGAAATVATITACGWLGLAPAAFASSTVTATTHSAIPRPVVHKPVAHPYNLTDCVEWLNSQDYPVNGKRLAACAVAALGLPTTETAILTCTVALQATRVDPGNAFFACTLAAAPN